MNTINKLFKTNRVPIWFMRQAGRYLSEYMEIRSKYDSFLDLCYNPEVATEITLQPIKRFDFDAAIIFSDILVVLDHFGYEVNFENPGITVSRERKVKTDKIQKVYEAISLTRAKLDENKPLIGFCGSTHSLLYYLLGKEESKKNLLQMNKNERDSLISEITESIAQHCINQIKAGCDIIQIFDSHSGVWDSFDYKEYIFSPLKIIINKIKNAYPEVGIIWFPRNSILNAIPFLNEENNGIDCVSLDYSTPMNFVDSMIQKDLIFQGNLDPVELTLENLNLEKINQILSLKRKLIFNLGHGITPDAKIENVHKVINYIRKF